jgi:hypothetical protein
MAITYYTATCQNKPCGKQFTSLKKDRKYCSMKCYASTPEFRARAASSVENANKHYRPKSRAGDTVLCAHCGKEMYRTLTQIKRKKKTCSLVCYRQYMAARFDRAVGVAISYKDLQGYDEFLLQDKLPCLVEGCDWEGHNLSLHMNLTHSIKEEDFKRMAGFNLSTGVVSASMADHLQARGNQGHPESLNYRQALDSPGRNLYRSKECREHMSKASLLRHAKLQSIAEDEK